MSVDHHNAGAVMMKSLRLGYICDVVPMAEAVIG